MSVFDDPNKELEQLQEMLSRDEEWFQRELDSAKRMIGDKPEPLKAPPPPAPNPAAPAAPIQPEAPVRNYANNYGAAQPRPKAPVRKPQDDYDRIEPEPKKKRCRGLVILAIAETLAILGLAAYWVQVLGLL